VRSLSLFVIFATSARTTNFLEKRKKKTGKDKKKKSNTSEGEAHRGGGENEQLLSDVALTEEIQQLRKS